MIEKLLELLKTKGSFVCGTDACDKLKVSCGECLFENDRPYNNFEALIKELEQAVINKNKKAVD